MTTQLLRVTTYGQPIFKGPGPGPLWRHHCGQLAAVDLLGGGWSKLQPWEYECQGCGCAGRDGWQALFAFTGAVCDQCHGNGWVPIGGKVIGAPCAYETVTECTACDASGVAR
jgi:hypothetical protein